MTAVIGEELAITLFATEDKNYARERTAKPSPTAQRECAPTYISMASGLRSITFTTPTTGNTITARTYSEASSSSPDKADRNSNALSTMRLEVSTRVIRRMGWKLATPVSRMMQ